jgi:rhodanese-related sulfurtransferase
LRSAEPLVSIIAERASRAPTLSLQAKNIMDTKGNKDNHNADQIIAKARQRARELKLPYAGALLPKEAFEVVRSNRAATLVDVRTQAEWDYVGRVADALEIEWNRFPSGRNPDFAIRLQATVTDKSAPILFLCRSGGRSNAAAALAAELGYTEAYNILEGFEGDLDPTKHRNTVGGWRAAGLPWFQS